MLEPWHAEPQHGRSRPSAVRPGIKAQTDRTRGRAPEFVEDTPSEPRERRVANTRQRSRVLSSLRQVRRLDPVERCVSAALPLEQAQQSLTPDAVPEADKGLTADQPGDVAKAGAGGQLAAGLNAVGEWQRLSNRGEPPGHRGQRHVDPT